MTRFPLSAFIEADLRLLSAAEGGRRQAIHSGYRCNCRIDRPGGDEHDSHDATVLLVDTDRLEPGASTRARLQPHHPDRWSDVTLGATVELCEGPRTVGRATVVGLFPDPRREVRKKP